MRGHRDSSWRSGLACLAGVLVLARTALGALAPEATTFAQGARVGGDPRVSARLLFHPDDDSYGTRVRAGVLFELKPGWHLYWRNPGDSGLATQLHWSIEGGSAGPLAWPAPTIFREADGTLTTYGYTDRVLLATKIEFADRTVGNREVEVDADLLVCKRQCVPASLRVAGRPGADPALPAPEIRALFESAARSVPVAPAEVGLVLDVRFSQSAIRPGDAFRAAIGIFPAATEPRASVSNPLDHRPIFIPDAHPQTRIRFDGTVADDGNPAAVWITLSGQAEDSAPTDPGRLRGVLSFASEEGGIRALDVDVPMPRAPRASEIRPLPLPGATRRAPTPSPSVLLVVALAFLGGLILNLMPCVLPVLAIKVIGIVELAGSDRRTLRRSAAAYSSGVLGAMVALATSVIALQAAGHAVGWGFQLQEPRFVAGVAGLLVVFALNLLGAFEVGFTGGKLADVGQSATGIQRSFLEGLLAVVLATPCSAPFLGAAVGVAFAKSPGWILAIFLSIGAGLAAPYVLLSMVPAWRKFVPRPGPWMLELRAVLGFVLLGSVVWLLWVVSRTAGADVAFRLLAFLWLVALLAWAYGLCQRVHPPGRRFAVGAGIAVLIGLGSNLIAIETDRERFPLHAMPFSEQQVREQVAKGRTVFVYFTADWCITCKTNERWVLEDPKVADAVERSNVAVFRADWTRRDEDVSRALSAHGRAGVPAYVVHRPDAPDRPVVLPEILTVSQLVSALLGPPQSDE